MGTKSHFRISHHVTCATQILMLFVWIVGYGDCAVAEPFRSSDPAASSLRLNKVVTPSPVPDSAILGVDRDGLPMVCGTGLPSPLRVAQQSEALVPAGTRLWRVVPSVVRDDGTEVFRLEVAVGGTVQGVQLCLPYNVLSASGATCIQLKDDGRGLDHIGGDGVYTSEGLSFNAAYPPPIPFYLNDSNSPPGLAWISLGSPQITEVDNSVSEFLIWPEVGLLSRNITPGPVLSLSSNVQAAPHLVNVQTVGAGRIEQTLRSVGIVPTDLSRAVYSVLPDDFDFLVCIPSEHLEYVPRIAHVNFVLGLHIGVAVDYSGTGQPIYNNGAFYGSAGHLKSVNLIDTCSRGVQVNNVAHEITHQWSAYLDYSLGLNEDGAHYKHRSNIGSLVGGQLWDEPSAGSFVMNCDEGRNGSHHAPSLDRYMMGLEPSGKIPISRVYADSLPGPFAFCDQVITNIVTTVTINQILSYQGERLPGPAAAQRQFQILFVAESGDRLFTPTEMAFYEILGAWFTKAVPAGQPDPYLTQNWVSVRRFFGEDTFWSSRIDAVVRPVITRISPMPGGVHLQGHGFPGATYVVWGSEDLASWEIISAAGADNNGQIEYTDRQSEMYPTRFYRLSFSQP